jgi:hypothetical protein
MDLILGGSVRAAMSPTALSVAILRLLGLPTRALGLAAERATKF